MILVLGVADKGRGKAIAGKVQIGGPLEGAHFEGRILDTKCEKIQEQLRHQWALIKDAKVSCRQDSECGVVMGKCGAGTPITKSLLKEPAGIKLTQLETEADQICPKPEFCTAEDHPTKPSCKSGRCVLTFH